MKLPTKEVKLYKRNKLVCGVGVNDADYAVTKYEKIDGKLVQVWMCPLYKTWKSVLVRCYSEKGLRRRPTYRDCSLWEDWKYFSNFKRWMEQQDWEGKALDKDLLIEGNKVYSPETCIFVDMKLNAFVNDRGAARGEYLIGVTWDKKRNKFRSQCHNASTGEREYLGLFTDELEAHLAWKAKKHEFACQLADSEYVTDERLANALRTRYNEQSDWTNK